MSEANGVTPTLLNLYPRDRVVVRTFADAEHDGNQSAAVRAMIRHFERCQFPLIGLADHQPDLAAGCEPCEE